MTVITIVPKSDMRRRAATTSFAIDASNPVFVSACVRVWRVHMCGECVVCVCVVCVCVCVHVCASTCCLCCKLDGSRMSWRGTLIEKGRMSWRDTDRKGKARAAHAYTSKNIYTHT